VNDLTTGEKRCNVCGGKSIAAASPISLAPGSSSASSATFQGLWQFPAMSVDHHLGQLQLTSPRDRGPHGLQINSVAARQRQAEEGDGPTSPDAKRRRYNNPQIAYVQTRGGVGPGSPYAQSPQCSPRSYPQSSARRESMSRPGDIYSRSPGTASMGPPSTPRHALGNPQSPVPHGYQRANAMTLPPIQSPPGRAGSMRPTTSNEGANQEGRDIRAIVMNIPFRSKLSTLHKICPPVGALSTSHSENAKTLRGAIVAVEGRNPAAVSELVDYLETFLTKSGDHYVRVLEGPKLPGWRTKATILEMLGVIAEWHKRGADMKRFIMPYTSTQTDDNEERRDEKMEDVASAELQRRRPLPPTSDSTRPLTPSDTSDARMNDANGRASQPVILLKTYTLHATEQYACIIPITDSYGPTDHWQWMATMWRGTPGPDITIYVKEVERPVASCGSGEQSSGKGEIAGDGTKSPATPAPAEIDKIGTVEVREHEGLRWLWVWKEKGKEVEERALRRLGFELGEWIRAVGIGGKK
jgi:hypothetical protein